MKKATTTKTTKTTKTTAAPKPKTQPTAKIGGLVSVRINRLIHFQATIIAIRFSRGGKVHFDLNVETFSGVVPFYNIDSKIVTFSNAIS